MKMTASSDLPFLSARAGACLSALLLLAGLSGCAAPQAGVTVRKNGAAATAVGDGAGLYPQPNLSPVISPSDRLHLQILPVATKDGLLLEPYDEVKYSLSFEDRQYHVLAGDELSVRFGGDGKRDFVITVRPDGRITLPETGEIMAEGKTPEQLGKEIDEQYRARFSQPAALVVVTKSNLSLADLGGTAVVQDDGTMSVPPLGRVPAAGRTAAKLSEELSQRATARFGNTVDVQVSRQLPTINRQKEGLIGFDRSVLVAPDGRLALPELGAFDAAGKAPHAVEEEIVQRMKGRYLNAMTVSLVVESSEARVVYVGGEVSRPGAYPLVAGMTTLRALLLAGGAADTGDLSAVALIHRDASNDVFIYLTNLDQFMEKGTKQNDLALSPQDVVLVPRTGVAKANLWIEQYITRMLPFSRSVSYSYNQGETLSRINNTPTAK